MGVLFGKDRLGSSLLFLFCFTCSCWWQRGFELNMLILPSFLLLLNCFAISWKKRASTFQQIWPVWQKSCWRQRGFELNILIFPFFLFFLLSSELLRNFVEEKSTFNKFDQLGRNLSVNRDGSIHTVMASSDCTCHDHHRSNASSSSFFFFFFFLFSFLYEWGHYSDISGLSAFVTVLSFISKQRIRKTFLSC